MKTMSVSSRIDKIRVLQDISLQVPRSSNSNLKAVNQHKNDIYSNCLIDQRHNSDDQNEVNNDDHNSTPRSKHTLPVQVQRLTASAYFFDEEPVFSDSDEEKEYNRKIFETQGLGSLPCATSKKRSMEVQCNLFAEDSDIFDLIRKGASINTADVNDDFKVLINLCRQLQYKYKFDTRSLKRSSEQQNNSSHNNMGNSTIESRSIQQSGISPSSKKFKSYGVSENIMPSRSGNSYGNNKYLEAICTFDKNIVSGSSITKPISHNDKCKVNEVPVIRRSARLQKRVQHDNGASPVMRKNLTLPTTTTNKLKKSITRKRKTNSMHINLENSKRASKNAGRNVKNRTTKRSTRRSINKSTKIKNKKSVKDACNKNSKRRNNNIPQLSRYKSKPSFPMKSKVNLENLQDDVHIKIPLPKKLVRSLARNWMNPTKSVIKNYELTVHRNGFTSPRHKVRHLYSPEKWLLSEQLNNICKDIK